MSWIKIRTDLRNHPKVVRMASALKADRLRVLGGLQVVWGTFDTHSADGLLEGYTLAAIDEDLGWKGFGAAMHAVRWLEEVEDGLIVPEFDTHNGASAKKRAQDTKLKQTNRAADKDANGSWNATGHLSGTHPDKNTTDAGPEADNSRTRVREDKKNPTGSKGAARRFDPSALVLPPWLDPEDWYRWCRDRAARKKPVTEEGAKSQLRKLDELRAQGHSPASVIDHSIAGGYQGLFAPSRVNGATVKTESVADQASRVRNLLTGGRAPAPEVIDV